MQTDIHTGLIAETEPGTPLGRILGAGFLHERTVYLPWRVLGSYALVYVLHGSGQYQDASGCRAEVSAGSLLLLFPELAHRYGPVGSGRWAEFHVIFEGKTFDLWREAGLLDSRRPVWTLRPEGTWLSRFSAIAEPLETGSESGSLLAVSRLLSVLTEAAALHAAPAPSPAVAWLMEAKTLLAADLSRERTAAEVAARLGLSYETFRKTFEHHAGVSPARYRAHERLQAAQVLLAQTAMTSRQIADSLGFPDEFYFSRRFRRLFGLSPRGYRRQISRTLAE